MPMTALAAVGLATGGGFLAHRFLDLADVAMLYVLCITVVATRSDRSAALLTSVLSVAALDFFFIPPYYTFRVGDIRHLGTFGVMLGVGYVVANLAERVRLQAREQARLAEERTEARIRADHEQMRSTLLSSVSHDLRTPLGTIAGATSTLLDPGPDTTPEMRHSLLLGIHQEASRLERLVNNLLDLTKLESGQVQVRKEWVPLEEVVGSAVTRMEEQLGDRPLSLVLREAWVPLDPVLFEQVLLNLLDNALKFSPPGSPIEVQSWVEGQRALVLVADAGPGFLPGEEEQVFDKLYRGARSQTSPGAGLGLAICRGILQAHGGTITAANGPEGGARMLLTLPLDGAPPQLPAEGEGP